MATSDDFQATSEPESPKRAMTKRSQRLQIVKVFILALMAAVTAAFTIMDVVQTVKTYSMKQTLKQNIKYSIETASLIHNLQQERGLSALFSVVHSWNTKLNREKLAKFRNNTDESIKALKNWKVIKINGTTINDSPSFLKVLQNFRDDIGRSNKTGIRVTDHLNRYSSWINELMSWLPQYTAYQDLENYAEDVFAYQLIIHSKEEAGLEKALGAIHFIQGKNFSSPNISWYNEKRTRSKTYLETAFSFSHEVYLSYRFLLEEENTSWLEILEEQREFLASNNVDTPSESAAHYWYELMTKYNNLMLKLQIKDANRIQDHVDSTMQTSIKWLVLRFFLLIFALLVVPIIIISLVKVQNAFYIYTLSLYNKVGLEQGRTEFLMRENARHVEDLASRWKSFAEETMPNSGTCKQ